MMREGQTYGFPLMNTPFPQGYRSTPQQVRGSRWLISLCERKTKIAERTQQHYTKLWLQG